MTVANNSCNACDAIYTVDSISDLQVEVDRAIAKAANSKNSSDKYNLNKRFNEESVQRLIWYNNILTKITYCAQCMEDYEIEDIVNLVKTEITRSKN